MLYQLSYAHQICGNYYSSIGPLEGSSRRYFSLSQIVTSDGCFPVGQSQPAPVFQFLRFGTPLARIQWCFMAAAVTPARFNENRRSSLRLPMAVPVVLTGTDTSGNPFNENTQTVVINSGGAKVLTRQSLALGTRLQVTVPHLRRESGAIIVWLGDQRGGLVEAGLDLDDKCGFWGVQFPDDTGSFRRTALVVDPNPPPPAVMDPEQPVRAPAPVIEMPLPNGQTAMQEKLLEQMMELAQTAIEQSLERALEQLNRRAEESLERAQAETLEQAQVLLRHVVESAVDRLDKRAASRLAEFDAAVADRAQKVRQELALTLAHLGHTMLEASS